MNPARWVQAFIYPVTDREGNVREVVLIHEDTTRRMLGEEALRTSEARYRALVEHFPNGAVFLFDRDLRYVVAGGTGLATSGLSPEMVIGKTIWELFPAEIAARDEPTLRAALRGVHTRVEVAYGDQTFVVHTSPVTDAEDAIIGGMVMTQDITERKQLEAASAELLVREHAARAEAEEALRVRDAFLSLAAHELKTPLTTLLGHAELLQRRMTRDYAAADRDQRALMTIVRQARRLSQLTSALLDVSRLETGQLTIETVPLDVRQLVERVVTQLQPALKNHTMTWCVGDEPLPVMGDELRLEQTLENLLANAVKYSPDGGAIAVRAERRGSDVCIAVTDHRIGISKI